MKVARFHPAALGAIREFPEDVRRALGKKRLNEMLP